MKGKVSKTGYKRTSPDRNNDYNIIPSGRITMQDVDFPVYGVDNFGNEQMMYPGEEYRFPGNQVFELPMAQAGLNWRDVAPRPDISERRDATQVTRQVVSNPSSRPDPRNFPTSTISQYEEPSAATKVLNTLANPVESFGYLARGQRIPDRVGTSSMDMALDMVNPFAWANYARKSVNDLSEGNFVSAGFNALGAIPAVGFADDAGRVLNYATTQTPLRNAWRLNPGAYQYNLPENTMWRGLGQEGMEDAVSSGLFRSKQDVPVKYFPGSTLRVSKSFGTNPYFTPKFKTAATYGDNYLAEVPKDAANWSQRYKRNDWSQVANRPIPIEEGRILQKDWLRGYKPVNISKQGGGEQRQPTSWLDYANPMNWGVSTYDDAGTFNQAFAKARGEGQDEFMWYGNRYNTQLAPQSEQTTVNDTPPARPSDDIDLDFNALKKGVSFVESRNGKYMWNPESSATGLYGQRFSEIGDTPLYGGTREDFRDDKDAQERVFGIRYNEGLPGSTALKKDAIDLYREYYPIVKKNNIAPTELAALSNFLGRQGTRYYLGYVLRDGRNLSEVFPKLYGDDVAQKNKTPEEYLKLFREAAYAEEVGGEVEEKYPDYSEYDTSSGGWMAARKELGKNKQFKYGGKVMSTCTPNGY